MRKMSRQERQRRLNLTPEQKFAEWSKTKEGKRQLKNKK